MKQVLKSGEKNKIGAYGEQIAKKYLEQKGFSTIEQNYLKKWGEIDIISRETKENKPIIHFIEVKTVSYETKDQLKKAVSYGTWRPEENVHPKKMQRIYRTIESWLLEHGCHDEWQIDVISVRVVPHEKYATVKFIENVIL